MEQPWGLSGPEFLSIYWIALGVALAFAIVTRIRLRSGRRDASAQSFDVDELAYLAGGPHRVVEASIARLIESEALRSTRRGTVGLTGARTAVNDVDRAVLEDASRYSRRTLNLMIPAVAQKDAVTSIGTRLADRGVLVLPDVAKRHLRWGVAPLLLLMVVGIVRWVNGIAIGAPVGWLTLQLVISGVLAVLLTRSRRLRRTVAGDRVLAGARAGDTGGRATSPAMAAAGAVGLVALGGLAAHPDLTLRTSLMAQAMGARGGWLSGGSDSISYRIASTCSSSGGSSCGGSSGSSCGGGGGGCGGGGGS